MTPGREEFIDVDAALAEAMDEGYLIRFKFGGEDYAVDMLAIDGGAVLLWMRNADETSSVPRFLELLLGEEDFARIIEAKAPLAKYLRLAKELSSRVAGLAVGEAGASTP